MIGYTWCPTAPMRNLKYFLEDASKNKPIVHILDFIGAFIQVNIKHRVLWSWTVYMENTSQNMPTIL